MTASDPEATLTKREIRKQDRRQSIIDAARQSFLEEGYAATSMSGLLKTIGGSKATLWGYFRSKEELFAAVIEDVTMAYRAEIESELTPAGDLEPTLRSFCQRFMQTTSSPEALATWRLVVAESGRFPEVGQIFYDRAVQHIRRALRKFLEHHIAEGNLRPADPQNMADMLASLCAGQQTHILWGISPPDGDEFQHRASEYVTYFLRCFAT